MTRLTCTDETINNLYWRSCQVGRDTIFQIKCMYARARLLRIDSYKQTFSVLRTVMTDNVREGSCFSSPSENHVFAICLISDKSVSRYSIAEDRWDSMPELNVNRRFASASSLSGLIYVIAGRNSGFLNSIEKLSLTNISKGVAAW